MTYDVTTGEMTTLTISFLDEGMDLRQSIVVDGDEAKAIGYLPFFERDTRRRFAELFPIEGGVEL